MRVTLLSIIVFLTVAGAIYANDPPPVQPREGGQPIEAPALLVYEDPTRDRTADELIGASFETAQPGTPNMGFTDSAYWFRFRIAAMQDELVFNYGYSFEDSIDVYFYDDDTSAPVKHYHTGDLEEFKNRPVRNRSFVFPVPQSDSGLTVLVRLHGEESMQVPLTLWFADDFQENDRTVQLVYGLYYGVLLIMVLYNLLIYLAVRSPEYLYYIAYVFLQAIFQMNFNGMAYEYLWPFSPWWQKFSFAFLTFWMVASGVQFARSYLKTGENTGRFDYLLIALMVIGVIGGPAILFVRPALGLQLAMLYAGVMVIAMIAVGVIVLLKGYRPARFYMIAWGMLFLGGFVFIAYATGFLPNTFITNYSIQIGAGLEVVLLSLGLADRINMERRERERVQIEALETQRSMTTSFARFVPNRFLELLGKRDILSVERGDSVEREMTVLFSDIRSFTSLSESMTPEENFRFINSYLRRLGPVIRKNTGFIDKFIGDAIMALFPEDPHHAVRAALEMRETLIEYNKNRASRGYREIETGIGLHTGSLMLGTIGDEERLDGTVISDVVNVASRLEGLTKTFGTSILVSDTVFDLVRDMGLAHRYLGVVEVRGKSAGVGIYEILSGASESRSASAEDFKEAVELYRTGQFAGAYNIFKGLLDKDPEDGPARYYLEASERRRGNPNATG